MDREAVIKPAERPSGLVPMHIGESGPVESEVEWQKHGVEPRWLGMETSDCAAALNPSIFQGHGADELQRFLAGAGIRQETALILTTIGSAEEGSSGLALPRYYDFDTVKLPGFKVRSVAADFPAEADRHWPPT